MGNSVFTHFVDFFSKWRVPKDRAFVSHRFLANIHTHSHTHAHYSANITNTNFLNFSHTFPYTHIWIVCDVYAVAPLCRLGQVQTYNIARQETAKIICELEANPNDVHFTWKFNTSNSENLDLPASLIAVDRAKSVAHYTPMTEQVCTICIWEMWVIMG